MGITDARARGGDVRPDGTPRRASVFLVVGREADPTEGIKHRDSEFHTYELGL